MYDLTGGLAAQFSEQFLGRHVEAVWHTSVVVHGREWWFGSGVSDAEPGRSHFGAPHRVLSLGSTRRSRAELEERVRVWRATTFALGTYQLLAHNCNTFSAELTAFLGTPGVPREVLELPALVLASPLAPMLAPLLEPLSQAVNGQAALQAAPLSRARLQVRRVEEVMDVEPAIPDPPSQGGLSNASEEALFAAEVRLEFARLVAAGVPAETAGDLAVDAALARAGLQA